MQRPRTVWTAGRDAELIRMRAQGATRAQLAKLFNCGTSVISNRISALGLAKGKGALVGLKRESQPAVIALDVEALPQAPTTFYRPNIFTPAKTCQWFLSYPHRRCEPIFCSNSSLEGKSYCEAHHAVVYEKRRVVESNEAT